MKDNTKYVQLATPFDYIAKWPLDVREAWLRFTKSKEGAVKCQLGNRCLNTDPPGVRISMLVQTTRKFGTSYGRR